MKTDSEFDRNRKFKLFFYLRAVVLEVFAVSRLRNVLLVVNDHECDGNLGGHHHICVIYFCATQSADYARSTITLSNRRHHTHKR